MKRKHPEVSAPGPLYLSSPEWIRWTNTAACGRIQHAKSVTGPLPHLILDCHTRLRQGRVIMGTSGGVCRSSAPAKRVSACAAVLVLF